MQKAKEFHTFWSIRQDVYQRIENDQSKSNQTEINSLIGSILTPGNVRKKNDRIDTDFDEDLWPFKPFYGDI